MDYHQAFAITQEARLLGLRARPENFTDAYNAWCVYLWPPGKDEPIVLGGETEWGEIRDTLRASPPLPAEARTYHVEYSPATGTYRVIEYRADGDRWIVMAEGLDLTEARRRCAAFAR